MSRSRKRERGGMVRGELGMEVDLVCLGGMGEWGVNVEQQSLLR